MNPTYLRLEIKRILRDPVTLFFTALLPAFFYIVFGASQSYSDERIGNGNVALSIMIAMAAYGVVSTTVGIGGMAAVERSQGWGRQLGLTSMTERGFVATKTALALSVAMIPLALIFFLGVITGAEGKVTAWFLSALVLVLGGVAFALYGLCFGLAFRSEAAVSGAGGSVVILAFLGNIFFPLSGAMLTVAKFTPMYGYASLARYPVNEGWVLSGTEGDVVREALWIPLTNVIVWTLVFATVAILLVRRSRARQ